MIQLSVERREHGLRELFDIGAGIIAKRLLDRNQTIILMARGGRRPGYLPVFIIEAAHLHRRLDAETNGKLGRQPTAQGVERDPERQIGPVTIFSVQAFEE